MAELTQRKHDEDDSDDDSQGPGVGSESEEACFEQLSLEDVPKRGKLILDATCAPSDIRYPT